MGIGAFIGRKYNESLMDEHEARQTVYMFLNYLKRTELQGFTAEEGGDPEQAALDFLINNLAVDSRFDIIALTGHSSDVTLQDIDFRKIYGVSKRELNTEQRRIKYMVEEIVGMLMLMRYGKVGDEMIALLQDDPLAKKDQQALEIMVKANLQRRLTTR